jgi:hypothetical protein
VNGNTRAGQIRPFRRDSSSTDSRSMHQAWRTWPDSQRDRTRCTRSCCGRGWPEHLGARTPRTQQRRQVRRRPPEHGANRRGLHRQGSASVFLWDVHSNRAGKRPHVLGVQAEEALTLVCVERGREANADLALKARSATLAQATAYYGASVSESTEATTNVVTYSRFHEQDRQVPRCAV